MRKPDLLSSYRLPFSRLRAQHLRLGRQGEKIAGRLLRELGLSLLVRNYQTKQGEIDLVMRDDAMLCFVEVKTRRRTVFSRPADAVGRDKRRRIIKAAHQYLRELGNPRIPHRYDIVEVIMSPRRIYEICYWPNAFNE
ncbi:MAG: YraN family protein [Lentisphaeria bacterium]